MNTRYWAYLIVITTYVAFGVLKTFYDIFPWGAVIIITCILLAEAGTYISIKRRKY